MKSQDPDQQRNLLLAVVLSMAVLLGWQLFYAGPKMKEEQARQRAQQELSQQQGTPLRIAANASGLLPTQPCPAPRRRQPASSREDAVKASPRLAIETPSLRGSIALQGGRIDDLVLVKYHETVDPKSPNVVLFSPSGSPQPYFAEYGWVAPGGSTVKVPDRDTVWQVQARGPLTPASPVTLTWDNGAGRRLPAHDLGRRRLHVQGHRRGREQARPAEISLDALCAHPPLWHAEDRRATGSCTRA